MGLRVLAVIFILIHPSIGMAAEVKGLYEAEVAVKDQSGEEREAAVKTALNDVLSRLVRPDDSSVKSALRSLLARANHYVQQYRYRFESDESAAMDTPATLKLRVQFDEGALNDALQAKNVALWGKIRPDILVWLALEQVGQRQLVTREGLPEFYSMLQEAAHQKGLPILLPLMDLADQQNLSVNDVWMGFDERILSASARYDAAFVLTGRLEQKAENRWDAEWRLYRSNQSDHWNGQYGAPQEALLAGLAGAYRRLAARYIPRAGELTEIRLKVTGISGLSDFARVARYLESVPTIRTVQWLNVSPEEAVFRLSVQGDERLLEDSLALGRILRPAGMDAQAPGRLHYRVQP